VVPSVRRTAEAVWSGGLLDGIGTLEHGSGPGTELIGWRDRTAEGPVGTTPEELVAAAHAGSMAMAVAKVLGENGTPAQRLVVQSSCRLDLTEFGTGRIARLDVHVAGRAPGVEPDAFDELVQRADAACPMANALRGNVAIQVTAALDQPPEG
jgi:lipoyl-dependent peroxiredoxin